MNVQMTNGHLTIEDAGRRAAIVAVQTYRTTHQLWATVGDDGQPAADALGRNAEGFDAPGPGYAAWVTPAVAREALAAWAASVEVAHPEIASEAGVAGFWVDSNGNGTVRVAGFDLDFTRLGCFPASGIWRAALGYSPRDRATDFCTFGGGYMQHRWTAPLTADEVHALRLAAVRSGAYDAMVCGTFFVEGRQISGPFDEDEAARLIGTGQPPAPRVYGACWECHEAGRLLPSTRSGVYAEHYGCVALPPPGYRPLRRASDGTGWVCERVAAAA